MQTVSVGQSVCAQQNAMQIGVGFEMTHVFVGRHHGPLLLLHAAPNGCVFPPLKHSS